MIVPYRDNLMSLSAALAIFMANCEDNDEAVGIKNTLESFIESLKKKRKDEEITEEFDAVQAAINGKKD